MYTLKQFAPGVRHPLRQQQQVNLLGCVDSVKVKLTQRLQTGNRKSGQNLFAWSVSDPNIIMELYWWLQVQDGTFSLTVSSMKMQLCSYLPQIWLQDPLHQDEEAASIICLLQQLMEVVEDLTVIAFKRSSQWPLTLQVGAQPAQIFAQSFLQS